MRTSKDENDIDMLDLKGEEDLFCTASLTFLNIFELIAFIGPTSTRL